MDCISGIEDFSWLYQFNHPVCRPVAGLSLMQCVRMGMKSEIVGRVASALRVDVLDLVIRLATQSPYSVLEDMRVGYQMMQPFKQVLDQLMSIPVPHVTLCSNHVSTCTSITLQDFNVTDTLRYATLAGGRKPH